VNIVRMSTTSALPDGLDAALAPVKPRRVTGGKVISNVVLLVFGALFLTPLLWLIFASIDSHAGPTIGLPQLTLQQFRVAVGGGNLQALLNSLLISLIATIVSTVPAIFAAYAFSRRRIPWRGPALLFILMLAGVPITILIVPIYEVFAKYGFLALVPAAVFLGVTSLPFEIWIIKNFIDAVPKDLEEAARLERANTLQVLLRIVVPVAIPGIAAAVIFGFINAWGNFLVPLVLIAASSQQPAPVALFGFFSNSVIRYGAMAAYSILYSVPVVILYLALGRFFRGGFVLGGAVRG
jgi:multiple sugar transport system permease protein